MEKSILEIGAGKISRGKSNIRSTNSGEFKVFVDRGYSLCHSLSDIENQHNRWFENESNYCNMYSNCDIFEFLDSYKFKFSAVIANRIFEHMDYCSGEIGRLLEALHMITEDGSTLEIIVPNTVLLSEMLLEYEKQSFEKTNSIKDMNTKLILNTEFCNIKQDCHASIWTPKLAKEYIEQEGTWIIENIEPHIKYANRDIYMKILCKKP